MTFKELLEVLNECAKKPDFPMDVPICFNDQNGNHEIKTVLSDVQYLSDKNDYVCMILLTSNYDLNPEATCYYKE